LSARVVVDVVLFMASQTCIVASNLVLYAIVGEVNRSVPAEQRISYLFWHFGKLKRVLAEYRRLYPRGRLASYF
jgi:hypothetical protein